MSPYEQLFVDVKFSRGTAGFVSVYLHEGICFHSYLYSNDCQLCGFFQLAVCAN